MARKPKRVRSYAPGFAHSIATNEFGFYCLPEAYVKREAPRVLARGGVYERDTLQLLRRLLKGGGDAISGGAFIGDFLPALSQALVPDARLYSFEPNPNSAAAARFTIALNDLDNVVLQETAVSSEAGHLKLQTEGEDGRALAGSSRIVGADATGDTVEVAVSRLDDMVPKSRKLALIHLDVESHEIAALSGAERILNMYAPVLVLEAPKRWMRRGIEAHLAEFHANLGYTYCGLIDRNAVYRALGSG